ncbi:conjugal transfer protein [Streptomyces sp. NPDC007875]|uniref:conjugal transfer protein n=1 Tax=Streptomyces sp. NPDC007875 TaxID=3364783 RepID=UPI0036BDE373
MKFWKSRGRQSSEAAVENVMEEWEQRGPQAGGWDLSPGARANATVVARWFAWAVICAGPILGLLAWMSAAAAVDAVPQAQPRVQHAEADGTGPSGFAELFVSAFVAAGEGDQDQLAAYYPSAGQLQLDGKPGRQTTTQTTAVRVRQTAPGAWSVIVAARLEPTSQPKDTGDKDAAEAEAQSGALRYFQVPVLVSEGSVSSGAEGYVAATLPAEVAAPGGQSHQPQLGYGPERAAVPGDTRAQTAQEFLGAYLTGSGELDRYLAPGLHMEPVSPAPYRKVSVESLAVAGEESADSPATGVPADGTRQRLLVQIRATGTDRVGVPLSYALTLTARAGRWEIAALDATPATAHHTPPTAPAT